MAENNKKSFLDRTLGNLRNAWQGIAGSEYDAKAASMRPDLPDDDAEALRQQMRACLETRGGEVSARARAAALGRAYLALDATGRERFLRILAGDFDVDHDAVDGGVAALREAAGIEDRLAAEQALRGSLEAPRLKLLTQFNALPEGVKFLVDMRAELIPLVRRDAVLRGLEGNLKSLLATWFDVGFLELKRITWETASAALLEKLIAYEAVHTIRSWDDLKNRLESDRRCYAFFHPRMPDEPLIFVEVALVDGMSSDVLALLDESAPVEDPASADTAIFYSISNAQTGLAGISFGGFLIKRVADDLSGELKNLKTFATLSPMPGFRRWLERHLAERDEEPLYAPERKALNAAAGRPRNGAAPMQALLARPDWHQDDKICQALRAPLMRLATQYLVREKRTPLRALDPVAHFHLSNGARMQTINWMGDRSPKGLEQSAGLMLNYVYKLGKIEENHEAYTTNGKVAVSSAIKNLLKG